MLFIDDVQWADAASLDVLHYLARRFAESETPALLLLTLRMGERAMRPALTEWRAGMERALPLTHLPLGPLTSEDILRLLQAVRRQRRAARGGPGTLWAVAVCRDGGATILSDGNAQVFAGA